MPVKRYKHEKGLADKLFSEIIRSVGYCEAQGFGGRTCSNQLHTCHIITRKRSATRTDLRNGLCCCFAHHRYFHDYPIEFNRFVQDSWASSLYDSLYKKSIAPTKINWQERVEFLMRIKNGEINLTQARELEV